MQQPVLAEQISKLVPPQVILLEKLNALEAPKKAPKQLQHRIYTPEVIDAIMAAVERGVPVKAVAEAMGQKGTSYIHKVIRITCEAQGKPMPTRRRGPRGRGTAVGVKRGPYRTRSQVPPETAELIRRYHALGTSAELIAKIVGVSTKTVQRYANPNYPDGVGH